VQSFPVLKGLLSDKFTEVGVLFKERDSQKIIYGTLAYFALFTVLYNTIFQNVKGIVQPFELGCVTRIIRSAVKF
jgi:hypothetical protein